MAYSHRRFLRMMISFIAILFCSLAVSQKVQAASGTFPVIVLSRYQASANIGDEFYISAITSNGTFPSWKSSNSSIASVNTYGQVTAKKAGTVKITAKIKNAEATCRLTVNKTKITLSKTSISLEKNAYIKLKASVSTGHEVTWKSSKRSVATVSESGQVIALKPGKTDITATSDGTSAVCHVTVKQPIIRLNKTSAVLYPSQKLTLTASVSSRTKATFSSSRSSVAKVDNFGVVTALKPGTAIITAKADGVKKNCTITVKEKK